MKKTAFTIIISAALAAAISLTGCSHNGDQSIASAEAKDTPHAYTFKKEPVTVNAFKLDTYVAISVYEDVEESLLHDTLSLCDYYEDMLSMHKEGGALYRLNENVTDRVPAELGQVIEKALEWSSRSDGRFQISIGRVSELWDFTSDRHDIPSESELKSALETVDDNKIKVYKTEPADEDSDYVVEKPSDTKIDLGAVAKGYIADKLKEDLLSKGVKSAVINLGGNVLCIGDKNGEAFNIGIRKPFAGEADMVTLLKIRDCSAVSSGISERYFEKDGHIYHHILDPNTGFPYENELWQSTVISKDSLTGDLLSTICYCLGSKKALELCKEIPDTEIILVKDDLSLIKSDGADSFIK